MKKLMIIAAAAFCLGCTEDKTTLHVYNWEDYIDPELIAKFEAENNCHVSITTFDSNEGMIAKLLAGATGYDVMFPSSYAIPTLINNNLIQKLDFSMLSNVVRNFDAAYAKFMLDDKMTYSVPYAFSMTGLAYYKNRMPKEFSHKDSMDIIADDAFKGRVCILNDMREILGIALKHNGFSLNSTNAAKLAAATATAISWKKHVVKLDNEQYKTGLASGEFLCVMGYNSDILQVMEEDKSAEICFFIPEKGSACCFDEMVISKDSANVILAHKFIDFIYDAKNAAQNMNYIYTIIPNKAMATLLSDEVKKNPLIFPSAEVLNRLELLNYLGESLELYTECWDKFKAAK